jgi:type VI secretion system protein ImpK
MGNTRVVAIDRHEIDASAPSSGGHELDYQTAAPAVRDSVNTQRDKTNPFLVAASALLTLMTQIRQSDAPPDVESLHGQITREVALYVEKLQRLHFSEVMIDCSAYCLCAALDESILASSWGTQSMWVQRSLLSMYRSETWGGERFYIIAESLSREARKNIFVLELIYILLSLGFEGKFYGRDRVLRDEVRNRLFQKIRQSRGKVEKRLSVNWRDERPLVRRKKKRNSIRRLITCSCSAIFIIVVAFNIVAYHRTKSVFSALSKVGHESSVTAFTQLIKRSPFSQASTGDDHD